MEKRKRPSASAEESCPATAITMSETQRRSLAESLPMMPRSMYTILPPETTRLPGCGSAWKKPSSSIWAV